ncbi:type II toxin-antitoxin system RelE/ParE family toxin [Bacteroidota bacterium]
MVEKFQVQFLEETVEFLESIDEKAREKVIYNIHKAKFINDNELFKKLNDNIWEFRTLYNKTYYRLFAFWDKTDNKETVVIAANGIVKKSDKTHKGEIRKAERIRKLYFESKSNEK